MKAVKIISIVGIASGACVAGYGIYVGYVRGEAEVGLKQSNKMQKVGLFGLGLTAVSIIGLVLTRKA